MVVGGGERGGGTGLRNCGRLGSRSPSESGTENGPLLTFPHPVVPVGGEGGDGRWRDGELHVFVRVRA